MKGKSKRYVAVIGSRQFAAPKLVTEFVKSLPANSVVVSGAAKGVDMWAEEAAAGAGLETLIHHADWEGLGRRAGPVRNEQIIADADEVVAFWDGASRGTLNALFLADEKSIPIRIFDQSGKHINLETALEAAETLGVVDALMKGRRIASDK